MVSCQHRANRRKGTAGELRAESELRRLGLRCSIPLETGVKIIKTYGRSGTAIKADVIYKAKVAGDFIGIGPNGQAVLVEVKTVPQLSVASFKPHQLLMHQQWEQAGGRVVIVWVCPGWGIFTVAPTSFERGKPLHAEDAHLHHILKL